MKVPAQTLKDIVVQGGFVSGSDFQDAATTAAEQGKSIADILIFRGLISEDALGKLVAEKIGFPFAPVKPGSLAPETLKSLPEKLARQYRVVPLKIEDAKLHLAMEDPQDLEAVEMIHRHTSLEIVPYFTTGKDIETGLAQYKQSIKKEFAPIIEENVQEAKVDADSPENISRSATELPVIKILNTLLEYAHAERASDIHLEALEDSVLIRFRVDGILRDIISLPKRIQPAIVARIKILASLKIDEHRIPQDGRFKFQIDDSFVALRVSIIPGFYGENIVLRLLTETARPLGLEELGLSQANLKIVQENVKKPHGMILVTGPTGSGKTTTLYSLLNILNTSKVKVCTIEDPIEYGIRRVNQIQVNTQTGLTFAKGLRALLRHDPNIIMVGEIRDKETAKIAIHAALTGHLVLSTLHTNDAVSAIPRLLDMGIESYLVASTVNVIIAQRLVRKIAAGALTEYAPDPALLERISKEIGSDITKQKYYKPKDNLPAGEKGYAGRVGVYEVLELNDEIRHLTIQRSSADQLQQAAIKAGMTTIIQDGFQKIASGTTTLEEVLRVARE
ncbi:MAG: Flp pilus assembly complex ATPase component TadA [Candidatus Chisholmbacteria bacterium]|nr:Flp pilus assembly complex ATPase component TadA [Candidatus Chisholmbacteria bacterium]